MSGLFSNYGVDLPSILADNLGPAFLPAVIHRPGAEQTRDPNDLTGGLDRADETDHDCRGFFDKWGFGEVDGNLIKAGDRKLIILAGTISPALTEIEAGPERDEVSIDGTRYRVENVLDKDPASATWVLQLRTR